MFKARITGLYNAIHKQIGYSPVPLEEDVAFIHLPTAELAAKVQKDIDSGKFLETFKAIHANPEMTIEEIVTLRKALEVANA